jgi:hypothetical protein
VVVFVAYAVLLGWRGVLLIGTGDPVAVVLGIAVLVIPIVGSYLLWRETQFGCATEALARELEADGNCRSTTCHAARPAGSTGPPSSSTRKKPRLPCSTGAFGSGSPRRTTLPATGSERAPGCALPSPTGPARGVHNAREFAGKARQTLTRRS